MADLNTLTRKVGITGTNLESFEIPCGVPRTSSLEVTHGDMFICIPGTKLDGHDFICTAVQRGAGLIVCEKLTPWLAAHPEVPYITVKNTRLAAAHIWNEYCGRPAEKMMLVAVTGTNGKTSTTYFLREIFKAAGYKTGIIGTVRCLIGDEEAILTDDKVSRVNSMTTPAPDKLYPMLERMASAGVEIVFMEASSHSLSQYRLDPLSFIAGVFTGLTQDHLDYHRTMEEYYLAKRRLFTMCGTAVVNTDSEYGARLVTEISSPCASYSPLGRRAEFSASDISRDNSCAVEYTFSDKSGKCRLKCGSVGSFMVANTLAAASVARLFGIKREIIAAALENCPQIPGRMERVKLPGGCDFEMFIDYAHTPDALERVLHALLEIKKPNGRLVAVFGCGGDRDRTKRPIMGRIATSLAGLTVITDDNSRSENPRAIICDILRGAADGADCKVIEKREDAIRWVIENHRPDDMILLAGKGHEDYEISGHVKRPFSEKTIIMQTVEKYYGKD